MSPWRKYVTIAVMIQKVFKAYKFRFYPSQSQQEQLAIEFGHARLIWNWALEARTTALQESGEWLTHKDLTRHLKKMVETEEWLNEGTLYCLEQKLVDLDAAFENHYSGRAEYPRFKRKKGQQSVRYRFYKDSVEKDFNAEAGILRLPNLGKLKVKWSRKVEDVPKTVTVSLDSAGRYFVSMMCEVQPTPLPAKANSVGVDVGIKDVAVTSDGFKSGAPKFARQHARRLKIEKRKLKRKTRGSNRYWKQKQKIEKIYAKISNKRQNFLNQTSFKLVNENQVICLEDLCVIGMYKTRYLINSLNDTGLYELRRQIEYKAKWYGRKTIIINRWSPSSKRCHACGHILESLELKVRKWTCPECGVTHDRDLNAAKNVLYYGTVGSTETARKGKARGVTKKPKASPLGHDESRIGWIRDLKKNLRETDHSETPNLAVDLF